MKRYILGADIGGTTAKLGWFTQEGVLLEKWEIPTRTAGGQDVLTDTLRSFRLMMEEKDLTSEDFAGIGIAVPGPVREDGSVELCVNLGWGEKQVKEEAQEALGMPAAVENDANAAALGEMRFGGGQGCKNMVMVTLGTGVGGGVICGGRIVSGAHGYGGEIGHLLIHPHETERCSCGKRGCLEQYASATGIVRTAKKMLEDSGTPSVLHKTDLLPLTAKDVFDAAKDGDALAMRVVDRFAADLARGLSYISSVCDPEKIVIGGGVSKAGEIVTDKVKACFDEMVFGRQKETVFALATLGNDAGIYGCAGLFL